MKAETKRAVALILLVCHWGTLLHSQAPDWWAARQARNPVLAPDDYALINQGQLKHLAHAAYLEMEERLPGGAGPQITALVQSWLAPGAAGRDDYAVANLGQLKAVSALFHARLQQEGVDVPHTWTTDATDDDDFAPANIGQAKALFAFSIPDGMVDTLPPEVAAYKAAYGGLFGEESPFVIHYVDWRCNQLQPNVGELRTLGRTGTWQWYLPGGDQNWPQSQEISAQYMALPTDMTPDEWVWANSDPPPTFQRRTVDLQKFYSHAADPALLTSFKEQEVLWHYSWPSGPVTDSFLELKQWWFVRNATTGDMVFEANYPGVDLSAKLATHGSYRYEIPSQTWRVSTYDPVTYLLPVHSAGQIEPHGFWQSPTGPLTSPVSGWAPPPMVPVSDPLPALSTGGQSIPFHSLKMPASGGVIATAGTYLFKEPMYHLSSNTSPPVMLDRYHGHHSRGKVAVYWRPGLPAEAMTESVKQNWINRYQVLVEETVHLPNGTSQTSTSTSSLASLLSGSFSGARVIGTLNHRAVTNADTDHYREVKLTLVNLVQVQPPFGGGVVDGGNSNGGGNNNEGTERQTGDLLVWEVRKEAKAEGLGYLPFDFVAPGTRETPMYKTNKTVQNRSVSVSENITNFPENTSGTHSKIYQFNSKSELKNYWGDAAIALTPALPGQQDEPDEPKFLHTILFGETQIEQKNLTTTTGNSGESSSESWNYSTVMKETLSNVKSVTASKESEYHLGAIDPYKVTNHTTHSSTETVTNGSRTDKITNVTTEENSSSLVSDDTPTSIGLPYPPLTYQSTRVDTFTATKDGWEVELLKILDDEAVGMMESYKELSDPVSWQAVDQQMRSHLESLEWSDPVFLGTHMAGVIAEVEYDCNYGPDFSSAAEKSIVKLEHKVPSGSAASDLEPITRLIYFEYKNPEGEVVKTNVESITLEPGQSKEYALSPLAEEGTGENAAPILPDGGKVVISLPHIEFEVKHIEKERDADGKETQTVVNPGPNTMFRDEIVEISIKVPPIGTTDWTVDLKVEPEAMRNQNLPGRGDVKMYDFGELDDKGTPSPDDDTVTPDKTQFVLQASAGGERTIRAVFNKEGKLKIKMKSTDGKLDFTSPEYTITERVRKYAVPYPGFPNHDPNKYDQQFVDAAKHWGDFYSHPIDTVDRLKAISVAESNVGAHVQNKTLRPHDILTIGHPGDNVLATIQGEPKQWDLDLAHPKKPAADARYKKLNYPDANIGSTREAIKWGTLWLFVKAFAQIPPSSSGISHRTTKANPDWTYEKRNQAPLEVIDGIEEPERQFVDWHTWDDATKLYNSGGDSANPTKIEHAFRKGQHYYNGTTKPLWPIRSDKSGRP